MPESTQYNVFRTVFVYSALIIFAPISTFFGCKFFVFEGVFGVGNLASNVWSAVMAVVVLHVALGLFIYKAYFEADKSKKPEDKID